MADHARYIDKFIIEGLWRSPKHEAVYLADLTDTFLAAASFGTGWPFATPCLRDPRLARGHQAKHICRQNVSCRPRDQRTASSLAGSPNRPKKTGTMSDVLL